MRYRTDIDGLRALAVLGVVIFHLWPELIPGGFVGVDIFFVISGFLITSIIYQQMQQERFALIDFYARRCRRILPSFLIVCTLALAYGFVFFLTKEMAYLAGNIFWGSFSLANIYLYLKIGYFDLAALHKPFLILWSLSIEEQFYLLFPIALWWLYKKQRQHTAFWIGLACFISFAFEMWMMGRSMSFAFFFSASRFWEILVGCWLAVMSTRLTYFSTSKILNNAISLIGLTLILGSMFYIKSTMAYPSWRAGVPVLGTFLILLSRPSGFVNMKLLSHPWCVFVGLISYPLYLIHYPLIAFVNIADEKLFVWQTKGLIFVFSLLIATLLYYGIEKRVRSMGIKAAKYLFYALLGSSGIALALYQWPVTYFSARYPLIDAAIQDYDYYKDFHIEPWEDMEVRYTAAPQPTISHLFIGDSNMEQYAPRIKRIAANHGSSVVFLTYGGRLAIRNTMSDSPVLRNGYNQRIDYMGTVDRFLKKHPVQNIVIGSVWLSYFTAPSYYWEKNGQRIPLNTPEGHQKALAELENMLTQWRTQGKNVYLVLPMPMNGAAHNPRTLMSSMQHASYPAWQAASASIVNQLKAIAARTGTIVIDPTPHFCQGKVCKAHLNGDSFYKDTSHLRASYTRDQVPFFDFLFPNNKEDK